VVFPATAATIIVPGYGETGWQTYSYTFNTDWKGTFGIGVSNYSDMENDSRMLVDNLSIGPSGNRGFETGDFSGYAVYGSEAYVYESTTSYNGKIYKPTEGLNMANIVSSYFYDDTTGSTYYEDTSEWGGTNGAYITFSLDVTEGATLTFDWAFLAGDEYPYADFAFVFGQPYCGQPTLTACSKSPSLKPLYSSIGNCPEKFTDILAQIGDTPPEQVPEPSALLLLGFGFLGVALLRKKR
jgi:hypothetical protein